MPVPMQSVFSTEQMLTLAMQQHQSGDLQQAVMLYQQILQIQPNHADALHLLGVISAQQTQYLQAVDYIKRAIAINPNVAAYYVNLGNALQSNGQFETAITSYEQALALEPNDIETLCYLGLCFNRLGQLTKSVDYYLHAVELNPQEAKIHYYLAETLKQQNCLEQAVYHYQQAIQLEPHNANYHFKLAHTLDAQGKLEEAAAYYLQAQQFYSHDPNISNNLGLIYQKQQRYDLALQCYQQALQLSPQHATTLNNLGALYQVQNQLDQAIQYYQQALQVQSDYLQALVNLGNALQRKGELNIAKYYYQQVLNLEANNLEAQFGLAWIHLIHYEFKPGWQLYAIRAQKFQEQFPQLKQPLWQGEDLSGKRLLVHWEQGFGDTIQFVRYLSLIPHSTVIFACQPGLMDLIQGVEGIDYLISKGYANEPSMNYDVWIPLMSLPGLFTFNESSIPKQAPYINPSSQKVEKWQVLLQQKLKKPIWQRLTQWLPWCPKKLKIGIVWSGNPDNLNNHFRSCQAHNFTKIAKLSQVQLFSLQKGVAARQTLPENVISLTKDLTDFTETAAVIACLDLVITVDTAVAHLAGAMGKPVWVLLHTAADWRWFLERADNPWYPTMRLFRQTTFGYWGSVFRNVEQALVESMR